MARTRSTDEDSRAISSSADALADSSEVVVKLTARYNPEAHRLLATGVLAPMLRACVPVCGGLLVVVMDRVHGEMAVKSVARGELLPYDIYKDIQNAVALLHSHDLVFSDLRIQNIMVVPGGSGSDARHRGMLIDLTGLGLTVSGDAPLRWTMVWWTGRHQVSSDMGSWARPMISQSRRRDTVYPKSPVRDQTTAYSVYSVYMRSELAAGMVYSLRKSNFCTFCVSKTFPAPLEHIPRLDESCGRSECCYLILSIRGRRPGCDHWHRKRYSLRALIYLRDCGSRLMHPYVRISDERTSSTTLDCWWWRDPLLRRISRVRLRAATGCIVLGIRR